MRIRRLSLFTLVVFLAASGALARAQTAAPSPAQVYTRPRTVGASPDPSRPQAQTQTPAQTPAQTAAPAGQTRPAATPDASPVTTPQVTAPTLPVNASAVPYVPLQPARPLSLNKIQARVTEAQRMLKSRVATTGSTPNISWVTLAALDQDSSQLHLLTLPKETFITRGAEVAMTTSGGMQVRLRIVRPNYVNTQVVVSELATGRQLTPLVVEYPIEKFGRFREMAYYTSVHPALLTPELVKQGQKYVRTMLDLAAKRLKEKGKIISPETVDIAERLCIVEHVDHQRFRTESRADIYNEVYALFALNELDTYRYSVSTAGAGGMVQMIPSTYQMLRRQHPSVGLNPDFVFGMRNHGNALEAMLLYMQDTWNGLALDADVLEAMRQNWATRPELASAGYNSNPARLPGYIRRGGASWRYLIPRETQMYLQIYKSFEGLVPLKERAEEKK